MINNVWEAIGLSFIGGYLVALLISEITKIIRTKRTADLYIETFTGKRIYVQNPDPESICIEDVAHALANNCRFNGHCKRFYSVAEHSVKLAYYVLKVMGLGPVEALRTLLHDAPETYITDMPKPFKQELPDYQRVEKRLEKIVLPAFGFSHILPNWLKQIDRRVIKDERMQVMNPSDNVWKHDSEEPLGIELEMWLPERAEQEFLNCYYGLKHMIQQEKLREQQNEIPAA